MSAWKTTFLLGAITLLTGCATTEVTTETQTGELGNKPQRCEWFMDQGLGMFIHWSVDSQLGSVISHSMVGPRTI